MRRFAVMLACLLPTTLLAVPDIPSQARDTVNYDNHCLVVSLQIVGRHQDVEPLFGLCEYLDKRNSSIKRGDGWYFESAHGFLLERKIAHFYQPKGSYQSQEIYKAIHERHLGVVVSLKTSDPAADHAVVLTGFWSDWVSYVDPNEPNKLTHKKIAWFNARWRGNGLFLDYKVPPHPAGIKRVLVADISRR